MWVRSDDSCTHATWNKTLKKQFFFCKYLLSFRREELNKLFFFFLVFTWLPLSKPKRSSQGAGEENLGKENKVELMG